MGNFFPLWQDRNSPVHMMQWEHLDLTIEITRKAVAIADNPLSIQFASLARTMLDPALHSCQFWWASKKPMWNMNMIYKGLNLQRDAMLNGYKAISLSSCTQEMKREYYYRVVAANHIFDRVTDYLYME
jgi:hypothetical protein